MGSGLESSEPRRGAAPRGATAGDAFLFVFGSPDAQVILLLAKVRILRLGLGQRREQTERSAQDLEALRLFVTLLK